MKNVIRTAGIVVIIALFSGCANMSEKIKSGMSSASDQRAQKEATLPHCTHVIGTAAIVEPNTNWWQQVRLQSPEALIKMYVLKSGCFRLVDRGRGFALAEQERALAAEGNLRRGSNVGKGQMKAADYLITPDIVSNNNNAGGNVLGAVLGGIVPGIGGVIASNISLQEKSADVTLSVTDTRSSEQVAMAEGRASKTDIGFGAGGGILGAGAFGAAGAASYANTALGQVVALAYLDAFTKMVTQLGGVSDNAAATNVQTTDPAPHKVAASKMQTFVMSREGHLFRGPSMKSGIVRKLAPGSTLYPTDKKSGVWREVTDEAGEKGWVSSRLIVEK
ncbi:MAG: CsgG/HfaB family protein [Minisyncoccota bacterium]